VRIVDIGNIVHAADATGLVTITQTKPIFVNFTMAQEHLHKIHEKQALGDLKVQAYGADNVTLLSEGKLTVIDNAVDQTTGTIRLKATFENADERLWPGEFVDVRLILNTRPGVATVPQQTVQVGPNGYYAYVIKAGRHGRAPRGRGRLDAGRGRRHRQRAECRREGRRRRSIPADRRGASARFDPAAGRIGLNFSALFQAQPGKAAEMNISEPFIRRPIATSLLMLGVLVFGIVAYGLLPVAALPKVDFPTIVVTTTYPGASPDTMASSVAEPLEQQFAAIPGLAEMTSTSGIGSTQITLQFDLERNIDAAAQDVLDRDQRRDRGFAKRSAQPADL
jgi:hypothetical protein